MPGTDVAFTFDPQPILKGVDKIQNKMSGMASGFAKGASRMSKSISKGIMSAALKIGTLFLAFKGVQGILRKMPEVGQAFGIAKDIFLKNLLWPLRKEIMPLLQKMLNWVRDHRTLFIKWGQTLASIFKTVVVVVKEFIKILRRMWTSMSGVIKSIFGDSITSLEELINVMLFKIVALTQFALAHLKNHPQLLKHHQLKMGYLSF